MTHLPDTFTGRTKNLHQQVNYSMQTDCYCNHHSSLSHIITPNGVFSSDCGPTVPSLLQPSRWQQHLGFWSTSTFSDTMTQLSLLLAWKLSVYLASHLYLELSTWGINLTGSLKRYLPSHTNWTQHTGTVSINVVQGKLNLSHEDCIYCIFAWQTSCWYF